MFDFYIEPDALIKKVDVDEKSETVVLIGSGAVENGWNPLRKAINELVDSDKSVSNSIRNLRKLDSQSLNILASFSFKFKVQRAHVFKQWSSHHRKKNTSGYIGLPSQKELNTIKMFLVLRDHLASSYSQSSDILSLRVSDEIKKIIGPLNFAITTNWDNVVWESFNNVVQLHGRCNYSDTVVFPTELIVEDTSYDLDLLDGLSAELEKNIHQSVVSNFVRAFRYNAMTALARAHDEARVRLTKANKVVVWGLSLADYDADVNALLSSYTNPDIELVVINPDITTFHRAIALTGATNAIHFDPNSKTTISFKA